MQRVEYLRERGVRLVTTDRNAYELERVLVAKLGFDAASARQEVDRVIAPFEVVFSQDYDHLRNDADLRLREGGKSDWPALAAAMAYDAEIWSDDVDFFGVGVPVWTTRNVKYAGGMQ